jgi:hypothetical protein
MSWPRGSGAAASVPAVIPVAPCCASPCDEGIAFVTHEGGGRCVRGLDRPSPIVPQRRQPGQAAGRIGWGWPEARAAHHPHQQCHWTWPAGRVRRKVWDGSPSPWHCVLPPRAHRRLDRLRCRGRGKPWFGAPRPCLASSSRCKRWVGRRGTPKRGLGRPHAPTFPDSGVVLISCLDRFQYRAAGWPRAGRGPWCARILST